MFVMNDELGHATVDLIALRHSREVTLSVPAACLKCSLCGSTAFLPGRAAWDTRRWAWAAPLTPHRSA